MSINIHEAKTHFSRLVERAAQGETIIIAKAGKPLAQLTAITPAPAPAKRRLGGLEGMYNIPDGFDTMFASEIEEMFYGEDPT